MIKTKSVHDPISNRDGLRLFVTRYWPRGHTRDECDQWMPSLAPSQKLLRQLNDERITWAAFKVTYRHEMLEGYHVETSRNPTSPNSGQTHLIRLLAKLSEKQNITLICNCGPDVEQCHRFLLAKLIEREALLSKRKSSSKAGRKH